MTTSNPETTFDYAAALQRAESDLRSAAEPDGGVRTALELVRFGWHTQPAPTDPTEMLTWDAMGTAAQSAADDLYGDLSPLGISLGLPVEQGYVPQTRALLELVVDRLERAAADQAYSVDRRWAWAAASGRLATALNGAYESR